MFTVEGVSVMILSLSMSSAKLCSTTSDCWLNCLKGYIVTLDGSLGDPIIISIWKLDRDTKATDSLC